MKPLMLITGPVATRSGYGSHSRDLVRSLIAMDRFDIKINSLRWGNTPMNALDENNPDDKIILERILTTNEMPRQPDVHIQISVPNEFTSLAKYNIGITAGIENTAPKPDWIQGMNRMNMNIVPSKFVKGIFETAVYEEINEQTKQKTGELKSQKPIEVCRVQYLHHIFLMTGHVQKILLKLLKSGMIWDLKKEKDVVC